MAKLPKFERRFFDLVPGVMSRSSQAVFGAALAGLGWLGFANAEAAGPTVPTPAPSTISLLQDREKKWPRLVLRLKDLGTRILASHRSHASHASHSSHVSHYSGSDASAQTPKTPPTTTTKTASEQDVFITVVTADAHRRVVTGRNSLAALIEFQIRDDTMIEGGTVVGTTRLDEYLDANPGKLPFAAGNKISITWKNGQDGKRKIAVRVQIQ